MRRFEHRALNRHGIGLLSLVSIGLLGLPASASPVDAATCLTAAERIDAGETLSRQERREAHAACLAALSATGSVLQKYQFQEAAFLIAGKRGAMDENGIAGKPGAP